MVTGRGSGRVHCFNDDSQSAMDGWLLGWSLHKGQSALHNAWNINGLSQRSMDCFCRIQQEFKKLVFLVALFVSKSDFDKKTGVKNRPSLKKKVTLTITVTLIEISPLGIFVSR